ncbi:MAG: cupin domain-containing protein [Vallitaleaceae bacterium]|nr:cupin domain-containing protein [Vallitaleaceae bacterium]
MTSGKYVKELDMTKHPEGGYYKEVYKHQTRISINQFDNNTDVIGYEDRMTDRALATSIYFLLEKGDISHLHVLESDELWYFHDGEPLTIVMINPKGDGSGNLELKKVILGLNLSEGQKPQVIVPAGMIFGSLIESNLPNCFSLVGCMVSLGFEFEDFRLVKKEELLPNLNEYEALIRRMCIE